MDISKNMDGNRITFFYRSENTKLLHMVHAMIDNHNRNGAKYKEDVNMMTFRDEYVTANK